MKIFRTITCSIAVAGAVAFCATSAKASPSLGFTTNYDELNITMTVTTSKTVTDTDTKFVQTTTNVVYNNKKILELLSSPDFADMDLTHDKLVVSWDGFENITGVEASYGDILVIDDQGNVLYDATVGTFNGDGYNSMAINFFYNRGASDENDSIPSDAPRHLRYHLLNVANFSFHDDSASYLDITAQGPATANFTQDWDKNDKPISGSESENATMWNAGFDLTGVESFQTIKIHVTGSGHTKGLDKFIFHLEG